MKFAKIKNHIIALERKNGIEDFLKPFEVVNGYGVHKIPVSSQLKSVSKEERAILRKKKCNHSVK